VAKVANVVGPGQRYHWLGRRCACDTCWDYYLLLGRPPALSLSIAALGDGLQADISFFRDLSLADAPPPIPTPGIDDLRPAWLGSPEADGAVSTCQHASIRRTKRKQVAALEHLFCILPEWSDFFLELAFANTVAFAIDLAYSVQVKAPGLFSDDDWTELQVRHLAQFEAYLERAHWDRYSQDESIDLDDIKDAVHGDVHFQFHLDGFRHWLRVGVPTRHRLDGGRRYFGTGDDSSDGGGDIDADAAFGSDEGFSSNDADSDSSDWVDPYDCHY
jgi:hypothetical protein